MQSKYHPTNKQTNKNQVSDLPIISIMNRGGRFRGNKHHQHRNEKKSNSASSNADDCNPIVKCFRGYANELDDKHDRYERIVKYSRDITIESKRLIFLLHTIDMRNSNAEKTLTEAFNRLNTLCTNSFANIAKELDGLDPYQYGRAYSAGLQEFVEAYTYYDYLANNNCSINWNDLQKKLTYGPKKPEDFPEIAAAVQEVSGTPEMETKCLIQPMEFMLGLADISGEVMRKCINALGSGDIDACRTACNFIQHLYSGYITLIHLSTI